MTSCELVTFVSSVACVLSRCCNDDELAIMAAVFTQLGDSIATILAHEEVCCRKENESEVEELVEHQG